MARNTTYTVKQFVPDGKGGWRNLKDLSPEEYKIFCDKLTEGLLAPQAEFFKKRPVFFEKCCKEGLVTDIEYRTDKNTVEEEKTMRLLKPKSKKTDKLHLNLQWLCENHGKPEWEQLIVNRILTDLEEYPLDDETVFDLIDYDLKSQSAVLTARGVFYWLDILTGFFDEKDLLDVARYTKETERNNRERVNIEYYNQIADYILTWSKISIPHLYKVIKRDKKFAADLLQFIDYGQKFETEIACKAAPETVEI